MIHISDAARRAVEDMLEEMGERLEAMSDGDPDRDLLAERVARLEATLAVSVPL